MPISLDTIISFLPELTLILLATAIFLGGTVTRSKLGWTAISIFMFAIAAAILYRHPAPGTEPGAGEQGPVLLDQFSLNFRWTALSMGFLFVLFATQSRQKKLFPELLGAIVLITAGLMVVSSAGDLIMMFLGFELISIPTYVLLFIGRADRRSDEATAKYFLLSILSSAFMLYGFASLYGVSGEIEFSAIHAALVADSQLLLRAFLPVSIVTVMVGLAFKIAAVPFHFYAPDVYQASTNLNAAVLATASKIAGVIGIIRILVTVHPRESMFAWQVVIVIAVLTMKLGNFAALWQKDFRRMMGYSSIAHAGYLLIGFAAALGSRMGAGSGEDAIAAMVLYVTVYAAATIGAFATVAYLSDDDHSFSRIVDLRGVGHGYPVIGACLAVCMFSLSGIPPLAGFWGKLMLFRSSLAVGLESTGSMQIWFVTLAVIGALNAAVAAAYYLRVIATLYFQRAESDHSVMPVMGNAGAGLVTLFCVWIILGVGLFTAGAMSRADSAAKSAWYVATQMDASDAGASMDRSQLRLSKN